MARRTVLALTFSLLAGLALSGFGQTIPREIRLQILQAVVQIIPYDAEAGEPAPWSGSGSIISPDGYILTNYHVIGDLDTRSHYEWHAVSVTNPSFTDQPPQFTYWARYVASDPTHDLAVLKIEEYADETPVPAGTVFPSVAVGDSNQMLPGDGIVIVGYPGISGSTITFTSGTMSGWVGEDFETGGKGWIKTDAKIAHGNSGGAAFTLQGELIGVPTAGRTVQYAELDVEEQAYVRPIGLAWALIGPNVPTVQRAGGALAAQPVAPPAPVATQPAPPSSDPGAPSGDYGAVGLGAPVSARLAPATDETVTYHGYSVTVPAGAGTVVVSVDGRGSDLDLAVNNGAPITDYETVDYLDTSAEPNPRYVIDAPAGTVYVDVINLLGQPSDYTLLVTAEGGTAATTPGTPAVGAPVADPVTPTLRVPTTTSGLVGSLRPGQSAEGRLEGVADVASYHTFEVDVPAGMASVTLRLTADVDLDLAARIGGEIDNYTDDGNWDARDAATSPNAELTIEAPGERIYVDVFSVLGPGVIGSYKLEVR